MTAFFHVWHWLRSTDVLLAATLATILGATILYTLARTTPGVRPGAPRDRINDLNGVNAWRERDERILRSELHAAAGRLFPDPPAHDGDGPSPAWPPDLCHYPPCGWEDNWVCAGHRQTDCSCTTYTDHETGRATWITCSTCRPAGRHHRRADIVTATLDQLDEWRRAQ